MSDSTLKETTVGDVLTIAHNLCNALMDSRSYVYAAHGSIVAHGDTELERDTAELLARIDGALADAGEILGGRTL